MYAYLPQIFHKIVSVFDCPSDQKTSIRLGYYEVIFEYENGTN